MTVYVSPAMRAMLEHLDAGWTLCVKDYQAWIESGEERETVSPVAVGQLLSAALVEFTGKGDAGDSRYTITDAGRTTLSDSPSNS